MQESCRSLLSKAIISFKVRSPVRELAWIMRIAVFILIWLGCEKLYNVICCRRRKLSGSYWETICHCADVSNLETLNMVVIFTDTFRHLSLKQVSFGVEQPCTIYNEMHFSKVSDNDVINKI